jgi:hypothetical protein
MQEGGADLQALFAPAFQAAGVMRVVCGFRPARTLHTASAQCHRTRFGGSLGGRRLSPYPDRSGIRQNPVWGARTWEFWRTPLRVNPHLPIALPFDDRARHPRDELAGVSVRIVRSPGVRPQLGPHGRLARQRTRGHADDFRPRLGPKIVREIFLLVNIPA